MKKRTFFLQIGFSALAAMLYILLPPATGDLWADARQPDLNCLERSRLESFRKMSPQMTRSFLTPHVQAAAAHYRLDPRLVEALITQESGWRPGAESPAGAVGLMQFIPGTGRRFGLQVSADFDERRDPIKSLWAGCAYLRFLHNVFAGRPDQTELALAAYNCGENRVIRNGYSIPNIRETRNYVASIMGMYGRQIQIPSVENNTQFIRNEPRRKRMGGRLAATAPVDVEQTRKREAVARLEAELKNTGVTYVHSNKE